MTEENKPVEPPADEDAAGLARRLRKLADMNRDELGAKLDRSTAALIDRQQAEVERLTTERDAARSTLETLAVQPPELWQAHARATAAEAEVADLRAKLAKAGEDTNRLDFLDAMNKALNEHYGTKYRWRLILNHNVNRLILGDMAVDLHDSEGGNSGLQSCRDAIDERRRARTALDTIKEDRT